MEVAIVKLRDLGTWNGGGTPSKSNEAFWLDGTIPWVSPKDMKRPLIDDAEDHVSEMATAEGRAKVLPPGAVLVVTRSGILSHTLPIAVTTVPVTINQDLKSLVPREGISSMYVAYALRGHAHSILRDCSKQGTTVSSLNTRALLNVEIPLPDLRAQEDCVADIETQFSRLDEAVANLIRVKINLGRYKAAVLKGAVEGRLVPTEASLARARTQSHDSASALLDRILVERQSEWISSGARGRYKKPVEPARGTSQSLAEGWVWCTIDQLATEGGRGLCDGPFGSNLKTAHYTAEGPRVIRLQNIGDGVFREEHAHISPAHFQKLRKHEVRPGDLVIASLGETLPRSCLVPERLGDALVKADCVRFRPSKHVVPAYLNIALNSQPVRKRTTERVHGVGRPRLGLQVIREIELPLPPLSEQHRIVAEVDRRLSIAAEVEAEVDANLRRAGRLRQAILARAFTPPGGAPAETGPG